MILPIQSMFVFEKQVTSEDLENAKVLRRKRRSPRIPSPGDELCQDSLHSLTPTSLQATSEHKCHSTPRAKPQATTSHAELKVPRLPRLSWLFLPGCMRPGHRAFAPARPSPGPASSHPQLPGKPGPLQALASGYKDSLSPEGPTLSGFLPTCPR